MLQMETTKQKCSATLVLFFNLTSSTELGNRETITLKQFTSTPKFCINKSTQETSNSNTVLCFIS